MAKVYRALETQDGPWLCWDVVLPAWELANLQRQGYIQIDVDRQRGSNPVTGKQVLNQKKIDRWSQDLIEGDCIIGQVTLNYRSDDPRNSVEFDEDRGELRADGIAHTPDAAHRLAAIAQADDSQQRGSGFDPTRKVSVRIYNIAADDEPRLFYALNQEGAKADVSRSKFMFPRVLGERVAKGLVEGSPLLGPDNVNTVQNRISKRDPRLAAFNTFSKAIETAWDDAEVPSAQIDDIVKYHIDFWDALHHRRPEVGPMELADRQRSREASMAGTAMAVHAYLALAREIWQRNLPLEALDPLSDDEYFSRDNPLWQARGILVPSKRGLTLRNVIQTRKAFAEELMLKVGIVEKGREQPRAEDARMSNEPKATTKADAVARIAAKVGRPAPPMSTGSTEPKETLVMILDRFDIEADREAPKPRIARTIVERAGLDWDASCDSTSSPSGGGSTITLEGLNRLIEAVNVFLMREERA